MRDAIDLTLDLEARVAQLERERALRSRPLEWTAPTLLNSWVNWGGGGVFSPAGYLMDNEGFVHLRGLISSGTVNTPAFALPVGFQPVLPKVFIVSSNNAYGRIDVAANVHLTVVNNSYVSLEGVTFDTRP